MQGNWTQARHESHFSPLILVGVIFAAVCAIELLLFARFWLQLTSVSDSGGILRLVLDLSRPLVAPFSDASATVEKSVGRFERSTLVAGIAYLLGGAGLASLAMVVSGLATGQEFFSIRRRRHALSTFAQLPGAFHNGAHLLTSEYLRLTPDQARRALNMLQLSRVHADLVIIPAQGGCVVAAFVDSDSAARRTIVSRFTSLRDGRVIRSSLAAIQTRFAPQEPDQSPATH